MATVHLPRSLVALLPGVPRRLEAEAPDLVTLLRDLDGRFPGLLDRVCEPGPRIREHINVFVDGERVDIDATIGPASVVHVIPAVSGGGPYTPPAMPDVPSAFRLPPLSLEGRVAMVTGASKGLGHDLALGLAAAGATVVAAARDRGRLEEVVEAIEAAGGAAAAVELDLTDRVSIERAVEEAQARFGRLDILVNNAGLGTNHDAVDATEEEWDELFAVNVRGLFFCSQSAARRMLPRGYGRIVNMASQAGLVGIRRHAAYSASKAAVIGLTKVLALEWAPHGITVNALAPTWVYTPGTAERLDDPAFLASVLERIPVGRVGSTAEIAAATVYLASEAAGMVTGSVLSIDGGWTAQ